MARITVIVTAGLGERNDEIVDLIQPALYCLSVAQGDGNGFPGSLRQLSSAFPGQHCTLQGPHVRVLCANPSEVSGHGMAGGTFSRSIEVDFTGLRIAHQWINGAGSRGATADRHAVNESRDGRYFFCAEIKLWHALIRPAILNNGSDQLTIVIVEHELTTDQIGAASATASIGPMAKAAICAKNLTAARNHGGIGRRPLRIRRRTGHANGRGARRLGRGWRSRLIGAGLLDWSGKGRLLGYHGSPAKPK